MTSNQQQNFLNNTVEFFIDDCLGRPQYYKSVPSKHTKGIAQVKPMYGAWIEADLSNGSQGLVVDIAGLSNLPSTCGKLFRNTISFDEIHIVASYNLQPNE